MPSLPVTLLRGLRRSIASALGTYGPFVGLGGAAFLAVLDAHVRLDSRLEQWARRTPLPEPRTDILAFGSVPNDAVRAYVLAIGEVFALVAVVAVAMRLCRAFPRVVAAGGWALGVVALVVGGHHAPFLRAVALYGLPVVALIGRASAVGRVAAGVRPAGERAAVALTCAAMSLANATWIVVATQPGREVAFATLGVLAYVGWRARVLLATKDRDGGLVAREAVASVPLMMAPLGGLWRSPSWRLLLLALLATAVLRLLLAAYPRWLARVPSAVPVVLGIGALLAQLVNPLTFRDLPSLNHNLHESGNYAWVNSIYDGRLMMADASVHYGPLRTYLLALWVLVLGRTAEAVRLAQIVMNLTAIAALLPVAWAVARRRAWVTLAFVAFLLTWTPALCFMDPVRWIAFGWADLGRVAFPAVALHLGVTELGRHARIDGWPWRRLGLVGVALGLSCLYAQEVGPCAILAVVAACALDTLLVQRRAAFRDRLRRGVHGLAVLGSGVALPLVLFLGVYALRGKTHLLFTRAGTATLLFASGSYGAIRFPVTSAMFDSWATLTASAGYLGGVLLEYVVPPAVYALGAIGVASAVARRTWRIRSASLVGMTVLGAITFRMAMSRSDQYHLFLAALPAALVAAALLADIGALFERRGARVLDRVLIAFAVTSLAWGVTQVSTFQDALLPRVLRLARAQETPSTGPPRVTPGVPRAGDIFIEPMFADVARAVRARTKPDDRIFVRWFGTTGGEIYFLANRKNPTTFDTLFEMLTYSDRDLLLAQLKASPPALIVTVDHVWVGPAVDGWISQNYKVVERVGDVALEIPR